jgi:hypothetical protein
MKTDVRHTRNIPALQDRRNSVDPSVHVSDSLGTPNDFQALWNGVVVLDFPNVGAFGYTLGS